MADKAKHAHGSRKNLEAAIASKAVDAFDVLFLSGEDEAPAFGWLDKNGNPILITPTDDLAKVEAKFESQIAEKANSEDVETLEGKIATKADASEVEALQTEIANKVDTNTVKSMIEEATVGVIEVVEF